MLQFQIPILVFLVSLLIPLSASYKEKLDCLEEDFDPNFMRYGDSKIFTETKIHYNRGIATPVVKGMHSYLAAILTRPASFGKQFKVHDFLCSGVVMNRRWVLSRAIPVAYFNEKDYVIAIQNEMQMLENFFNLRTYDVDLAVIHPDFEGVVDRNDLTLLRVSKDLLVSEDLNFVPIATNFSFLPTAPCVLIVWTVSPPDQSVIELQKLTLVRGSIIMRTSDELVNGVLDLIPDFVFNWAVEEPEVEIRYMNPNLTTTSTSTKKPPPPPNYDASYMNYGAPFRCETGLFGVFLGNLQVISLLESDNPKTYDWIMHVTAAEIHTNLGTNIRGRLDLYDKLP